MAELDRQNLLINREIADRLSESIGLMNQGDVWLTLGDLAQSRRDVEAALQMGGAHGDRPGECVASIGLSAVVLWQGNETRALARQALDIAVASKARDLEGVAGLRLGATELALGRGAAARDAYAQAHARAVEIDVP